VSAPTPPALDADLTAGLRRLKLAAMRTLAPELLITSVKDSMMGWAWARTLAMEACQWPCWGFPVLAR